MAETLQVGTNYIVKTPGNLGGRARIEGRRIGVSDVVNLHIRLGASIEEIADSYNLTFAQIHAALAYYYDHRDEIDSFLDEEYAYQAEHWPSNEELNAKRDELLQRIRESDPERYEKIMQMREEAERESKRD